MSLLAERGRAAVARLVSAPRAYGWSQRLCDPFRLRPIRRALAACPHASLLDLGCGIGDLCGITDAAYTGVDVSPAYVAYARRRFGGPRRRFEVGDALALDARLGHHDVVALISVLHHFSDEDVRRCLGAVRAVTPRRLFLLDVALERAGWLCRRLFVPLDRGRHYRTTGDWRALLETAGWRVSREERCAGPLGIFPYVALTAEAPGA